MALITDALHDFAISRRRFGRDLGRPGPLNGAPEVSARQIDDPHDQRRFLPQRIDAYSYYAVVGQCRFYGVTDRFFRQYSVDLRTIYYAQVGILGYSLLS